ncbi:MAG: hypothetical protein EBR08_01340, partial [Bacteroidia bacterium]|nr:hypothetical protein [Bacteroidia bacterium]
METKEQEPLSRTEKSLYAAQLMQWAVLSSDKQLHIFVDYAAHVDKLDIRIYLGGWKEGAEYNLDFYFEDLTKEKIKEIQKRLAEILNEEIH